MRRPFLLLGLLVACLPACTSPAPPAETHPAVRNGEAGDVPDGPPPAAVTALLGEISPRRMRETVDHLAAFGTRHTLSETGSLTHGIGAARRWIRAQFQRDAQASGRQGDEAMEVAFDRFEQEPDGRRILEPAELVNVVARLPGHLPEARKRLYYVIGHYDSRASDALDARSAAPGADDDGSGVAVVLELARVMSRRSYDSTLVFMATCGEEQGLYGARHHADAARAAGLDIRAVLSNDIVGDPTSPSGRLSRRAVRIFSQALPANADPRKIARLAAFSDSPSRQLARSVARVAAWHQTLVQPMLVFRTDRFLRGGDHTAFNRAGYPAVRFTEVEETFTRQHQDVRRENGISYGDLPEFVDAGYLADVARVNGAALAHLANAPSTPGDARIIVAALTTDTLLRWSPSPESDLAGYEVVWRRTTSPVWEEVRDVGKVTEARLDLSKDNYFFGIRAYDQEGYRSPAAFPSAARE
ncbi:MAG: M20/M25/M40 family metallo-hydrolase [Acidobacteriota bacterium]